MIISTNITIGSNMIPKGLV